MNFTSVAGDRLEQGPGADGAQRTCDDNRGALRLGIQVLQIRIEHLRTFRIVGRIQDREPSPQRQPLPPPGPIHLPQALRDHLV